MGMAELVAMLAKYELSGPQIILKSDIVNLIESILSPLPRAALPALIWVDNATCKVSAAADSPATVMMSGFPNILNPTESVTGGLTDGGSRERTSSVNMSLALANRWGSEMASQMYAVLAISGDDDLDFTLKSMPYLTVKSQASQTITFGTMITPATDINYGFTTNDPDFVGGKLYVLAAATATQTGLLRTITANTVSGSATTITYSGDALTLAAGDRLIILPNTNFRRLGDIYNNASSNFTEIEDFVLGRDVYSFKTAGTAPWFCPLTWRKPFLVDGCGSGAGGNGSGYGGGGAGDAKKDYAVTGVPGTYYLITTPAGGNAGSNGSTSSIGALLTLLGGNYATNNTGGAAGGLGGQKGEDGDGSSLPGSGGGGIWGTGGQWGGVNGSNGSGYGAGAGSAASGGTGGVGSMGFFDIKRGQN